MNEPTIYWIDLFCGAGGTTTGIHLAEANAEVITEFEKAKTYYFGTGKKTSKNKSREGFDYYATPEPLGLKMVEWLNLQPGERALEPSAGHGAIGRFFPENTNNTFIEPSYELSSKLSINANGEVKIEQFENHTIWNKYEGIAMNPPFGKSGKTAMQHIEKATKHLSYHQNSKLIAIIPNGTAMQKRLDAFFEDKKNREFYLSTEISLPSVVFERAGTKIYTKIIVIEKLTEDNHYKNEIDLSHITDINEFFNEIECLTI
ncbi:hypothetical protein FORMB_17100 [Formosa sp. Hel1_33_131]|uniref:hypothetical protein n=1 Tax=Formosa sp. Hel1_33_131 TaxID=1336794 RepID=UPI00084E3386|nr:hypothetical protein [Formosa sp. Hel1_33_131]AOR28749.1 hypothetical protein FORMB_17100 [Formosa sp. Hel1_33_131]